MSAFGGHTVGAFRRRLGGLDVRDIGIDERGDGVGIGVGCRFLGGDATTERQYAVGEGLLLTRLMMI